MNAVIHAAGLFDEKSGSFDKINMPAWRRNRQQIVKYLVEDKNANLEALQVDDDTVKTLTLVISLGPHPH